MSIIYRGYKEPLIPLSSDYHGYEGVILEDSESGNLQCHICGEWHNHLSSHLSQKHKDFLLKINPEQKTIKTYKDMFGIMMKTSLVSDKLREKYIKNVKDNVKYWTKKRRADWVEKMRKIKKRNRNNNACAEKKNEEGICFMQLLDLIKKKAVEKGYTPSIREIKGHRGQDIGHTIRATFGSYQQALKLLKLKPNERGGGKIRKNELSDDFLIKCIVDFKNEHKRYPYPSDCNNGFLPKESFYKKRFGSLKKIVDKLK